MDKSYIDRIKEAGLKQRWIAEKMEMTPTTLSHKLSGKAKLTKPERFMLEAILRGEKID